MMCTRRSQLQDSAKPLGDGCAQDRRRRCASASWSRGGFLSTLRSSVAGARSQRSSRCFAAPVAPWSWPAGWGEVFLRWARLGAAARAPRGKAQPVDGGRGEGREIFPGGAGRRRPGGGGCEERDSGTGAGACAHLGLDYAGQKTHKFAHGPTRVFFIYSSGVAAAFERHDSAVFLR
jgi:hypothetical protein